MLLYHGTHVNNGTEIIKHGFSDERGLFDYRKYFTYLVKSVTNKGYLKMPYEYEIDGQYASVL
jgi:hypothetical protein